MSKVLTFLIKIYQKAIPVFLPRTCRFHPSCSSYALEAIQKYGAGKGSFLALIRIVKCTPFSKGGYDPVR